MKAVRIKVHDDWNILVPEEDLAVTLNEPFTLTAPSDGHAYDAACEFATSRLGIGDGRSCLVIGSPVFEVRALESGGWKTTLVDIRRVPDCETDFIQADACRLPFQDCSFDALSSTCCFCHTGLGRYGDPRYPDGDTVALAEAFRVLKLGARAAIMLGPSIPLESTLPETVTSGITHRVYKPSDAVERVKRSGFTVLEVAYWEVSDKFWIEPDRVAAHYNKYKHRHGVPYCYLCFFVEKPWR